MARDFPSSVDSTGEAQHTSAVMETPHLATGPSLATAPDDAPKGLAPPNPDRVIDAGSAFGDAPLLLVIVDTEEEFDWTKPLSRTNTAVTAMAGQVRAHDVFSRHGIIPTYVIDYPVAATATSVELLQSLVDQGLCHVGAHLHPWVNPPHEEAVNPVNSYPGNLPPALEAEKLRVLTRTIHANLGRQPVVYKAGRYGIGPSTPAILAAEGYSVDASVVAFSSFAADGGPDFTAFGFHPFWLGDDDGLLEIPVTCGYCGLMSPFGPGLYPRLISGMPQRFRLAGAFARLRLLERIRLTPEGVDLAALIRLTASLLRQGCRVFSFSYHSPSLAPGHTPYVADRQDLEAFLRTMDRYFAYFTRDLGGRPATPEDVRRLARDHRKGALSAASA